MQRVEGSNHESLQEVVMDTHGLRVDFGKYGPQEDEPGQLWTRIPIPYLRWMVRVGHTSADIAEAELNRRGISLIDTSIEISCHAIDMASNRLLKDWQSGREEMEGLHAWLLRISHGALGFCNGKLDHEHCVRYKDIKFVFEPDALGHTLKTVMRKR